MNATLRKKLDAIPAEPGVYLFYDNRGRLLYVGKAAVLRHRVRSYFHEGSSPRSPAQERMIRSLANVRWETTDSEIAALVREAQLIRQHNPAYNVLLRDDKSFVWVTFSGNEFPRVGVAHEPQAAATHGRDFSPIGPFTDGAALRKTLRLLRAIFPYCTCRRSHTQPCLNAHMGRCPGYCCARTTSSNQQRSVYRTAIRGLRAVLTGRSKTLSRTLQQRMKALARGEEFERAAVVRDQAEALEKTLRHSHVLRTPSLFRPRDELRALAELQHSLDLPRLPRRIEAYDVANLRSEAPTASMVVAHDGHPDRSAYRYFHLRGPAPDDAAGIREAIERRWRHREWNKPHLLVIDGGAAQRTAALSATRNDPVAIVALAKRSKKLYIAHAGSRTILLTTLHPSAALLLERLRDEAHRFARKLHHGRRSRTMISPA